MSEVKSAYSGVTVRIISAVVLIPPVVAIIWFGGLLYTALLAVGGSLMMLEWLKLTKVEDKTMPVIGVVLLVGTLWAMLDRDSWSFAVVYSQLFFGCGVMAIALKWVNMRDMAWLVLGLMYILALVLSMYWLRENGDSFSAMMTVFWVFLVVWGTDIGGYFAGKSIGGPKLAPKISPKKTWAGLLGGMVLAALASVALNFVFFDGNNWLLLIAISASLAVVAQIGDLLESAIKRRFDVKDSGSVIPGHGGLLDRVDGLVTVAALVAFMMSLPEGLL